MKKLILFTLLIISVSSVFAELEVDIPFDLDIVGDDFSVNGAYDYESEWITVTNIGSTTETYTLHYTNNNLPAGWTMSLCNSLGVCYMPNWPVPIELTAGGILEIHITFGVVSTGGLPFDITFDGGDLTSPMIYHFTFNTEDNVSSDIELPTPERFLTNYPNPFNPSTTILYELSPQELAETSITIFNVKGQLVRTYNELSESGRIVWNGKDNNGNKVNSGVYLYRLNNNEISQIKKMILIK